MNEKNMNKLIHQVFGELINSEREHYAQLEVDVSHVCITLTPIGYTVQCVAQDTNNGEELWDKTIHPDYVIRSDYEYIEWIKSTAFAMKVHEVCGALLMM